jgi:hypothetical protein
MSARLPPIKRARANPTANPAATILAVLSASPIAGATETYYAGTTADIIPPLVKAPGRKPGKAKQIIPMEQPVNITLSPANIHHAVTPAARKVGRPRKNVTIGQEANHLASSLGVVEAPVTGPVSEPITLPAKEILKKPGNPKKIITVDRDPNTIDRPSVGPTDAMITDMICLSNKIMVTHLKDAV